MKRVLDITGKTREEAVSAGLDQMNLTIADVQVEVLEEGSRGLFGRFGSRPWKVRLTALEDDEAPALDPRTLFADSLNEPAPVRPARKEPAREKAPEKQPEKQPAPAREKASEKQPEPAGTESTAEEKETKPARPPRAPRAKAQREQADKPQKTEKAERRAPAQKKEKPARDISAENKPAPQPRQKTGTPPTAEDCAAASEKAQAFLAELTRLMGVDVTVKTAVDEDSCVRVSIDGDSQGILIGRRGETLDALQYLTSLQVNRDHERYVRVTLDAEGYRARREEALVRLANRMASRAVRTGRRVSLEPMNPYERRILHSALQSNGQVATHSEGEEPNRHVVITVNKAARQQAAKEQADEE